MRFRRPTRLVAALLTALTLGACAAMPGLAKHGSAPPGGGTNRSRTEAEIRRLVSLVHLPAARSPLKHAPSALSGPGMGTPATSSLLDTVRLWKVEMPFAQAAAWVPVHPPTGLTAQGTSSTNDSGSASTTGFSFGDRAGPYWTGAELDVTIAPAGSGASDWRIDGQAEWLDPTPSADDIPGPRLHVTPAGGCTLPRRGVAGVTNFAAGLNRSLLPAQAPANALVCRYQLGFTIRLGAHRTVPAAATQALARLARRIPLSHLDNVRTNCPAGRNIAVVIAFGYPGGRTVDLWSAGACPSVANGVVIAGGAGGGGVGGFDAAVDRLLR